MKQLNVCISQFWMQAGNIKLRIDCERPYTNSFAVTNPVDVTKIRMQLEGELRNEKGQLTSTYQKRYYKGIIRGMFKIAHDEGVRGLYKG